MFRRFSFPWGVVLVAVSLLGIAREAGAQETPSTSTIIEALKPVTRSSRNLIVTERAASGPSAGEATSATPPPPITAVIARPAISMAVRFDFNSWRLRPEGAGALDNLAAALVSSDLRASRFLVEGHTDSIGGAAYNLRLSQQRADEVRRYLVAHGVEPERVATIGRGATQPADAADTTAAENRRVRIVNLD